MNSWKWNEAEDDALSSLNNSRAAVLYLRGLRKHMDYATGLVGVARRVSLQMFRELLEERRERGSKEPLYVPTNDSVRWLLSQLERAGLIERLPKLRRTDPMVFRLLLADTGSVRPNEEPQRNPKEEPQRRGLVPAGFGRDLHKTELVEEPHTSGISGKTSVNCNTYLGAVDKFCEMQNGWRVDPVVVDYLSVNYGFSSEFLHGVMLEFRLYWCERGGGESPINKWDKKFVAHVLYRLERGDSEFVLASGRRRFGGF